MIKIIGLGSGGLEQLPLGIYRLLTKNTYHLFLRTENHPAAQELKNEGVNFLTFDEIYEKHSNFSDVYEEVASILQKKEKNLHTIIYAVPGHPLVAEKTVEILLKSAVDTEILGGHSFLDAIFSAVKIDPITGFQLLDGTALVPHEIQITHHVIIGQVYDQISASDVKLTLLEKYPADHIISIIANAGTAAQTIKKVALCELDHNWETSNLIAIYVPPSTAVMREFWNLRQIFAKLRSPDVGCPWDRSMTYEKLTNKLVEEVNEYLDAVKKQDIDNMIEELGDILLHIMLSAQIGEDEHLFTIDDVIQTIAEKMIRRHPHVFGDKIANSPKEALELFRLAKKEEKNKKDD